MSSSENARKFSGTDMGRGQNNFNDSKTISLDVMLKCLTSTCTRQDNQTPKRTYSDGDNFNGPIVGSNVGGRGNQHIVNFKADDVQSAS
jgi:hypothetical protein